MPKRISHVSLVDRASPRLARRTTPCPDPATRRYAPEQITCQQTRRRGRNVGDDHAGERDRRRLERPQRHGNESTPGPIQLAGPTPQDPKQQARPDEVDQPGAANEADVMIGIVAASDTPSPHSGREPEAPVGPTGQFRIGGPGRQRGNQAGQRRVDAIGPRVAGPPRGEPGTEMADFIDDGEAGPNPPEDQGEMNGDDREGKQTWPDVVGAGSLGISSASVEA